MRLLSVGCWVLGVGCWVLGVGCWVLSVGCWVLGATRAGVATQERTRSHRGLHPRMPYSPVSQLHHHADFPRNPRPGDPQVEFLLSAAALDIHAGRDCGLATSQPIASLQRGAQMRIVRHQYAHRHDDEQVRHDVDRREERGARVCCTPRWRLGRRLHLGIDPRVYGPQIRALLGTAPLPWVIENRRSERARGGGEMHAFPGRTDREGRREVSSRKSSLRSGRRHRRCSRLPRSTDTARHVRPRWSQRNISA